MKILFFTDPHIGLKRKANSTALSSQLREKAALSTLHDLLNTTDAHRVCLGDLFDTKSNSEETLKDAFGIVARTDVVLAGNHDVSNREGSVSSLQLLKEVFKDEILINEIGESDSQFVDFDAARLVLVPHVASQELFDAALDDAIVAAEKCQTWKILCLHCNVMTNFDMDDTTLNLTKERAEQLLGHFHFILVGHEHTARDLYDGRLKVIGSTYPTAFDNLDQKRAVLFDSDKGAFEDIPLWSPEENAWAGVASEVPESPFYRFYDIQDDMDLGEAQKLAVSLFDRGAFGVRVKREAVAEAELEAPATALEYLPQTIDQDIRGNRPDLIAPWEEIQNAV